MTTKRSQGRYDYRQVAETSVSQLEKQNDELVDTLAQQVSTLKSLTIEIGDNVRDHVKLLGDMNQDFDSTGGLLGKSMRKVNELVNSNHGMSICYIVSFAVFVFIVIYFLSSR